MSGRLIIFCAPSGAGKSTIVNHLMQLDLGLAFSISATSRTPRRGEVNGREYYFMTPEQFRKKIDAGDFVEWEEVYPNRFYGTLRSELDRIWASGHHALFDIDVAGGMNLKKLYGNRALSVFVKPPSLEALEQRLRDRATDDDDSLKERLGKAAHELEYAGEFDVILINDVLDETLVKARQMVRKFLNAS